MIPQPGGKAWRHFQDWMKGEGNENLAQAVDQLMARIGGRPVDGAGGSMAGGSAG